MAKFWKTLSTIEEIIMVIGMVVMVFFNAFNVFCRYLLRKHRSDFFRPPKERGSDEQR